MEPVKDNFRIILESSWDHFGMMLGSLGTYFGIILGSCFGHFGVIFKSFWDYFNLILSHLGIMLGSFWGNFGIILGLFWDYPKGFAQPRHHAFFCFAMRIRSAYIFVALAACFLVTLFDLFLDFSSLFRKEIATNVSESG